jgi:hypothetical protein
MLKSDLVQTDKHSIKFVSAEKSPIFTLHKSYKNSLATSVKRQTTDRYDIDKIKLRKDLAF